MKGRIYYVDGIEGRKKKLQLRELSKLLKEMALQSIIVCDKYDHVG